MGAVVAGMFFFGMRKEDVKFLCGNWHHLLSRGVLYIDFYRLPFSAFRFLVTRR